MLSRKGREDLKKVLIDSFSIELLDGRTTHTAAELSQGVVVVRPCDAEKSQGGNSRRRSQVHRPGIVAYQNITTAEESSQLRQGQIWGRNHMGRSHAATKLAGKQLLTGAAKSDGDGLMPLSNSLSEFGKLFGWPRPRLRARTQVEPDSQSTWFDLVAARERNPPPV